LAVKSKGAEKPAKGRKGKAGKDPNKPKRAPSAFFVFMSDPSSLPLFFSFSFLKKLVSIWVRWFDLFLAIYQGGIPQGVQGEEP
jgi:hypothetical protein